MNGGSDAVQVMYMEVEGIKLAYQVSKDAARLAKQLMTFLIRAMMDAPYRKVSGKTNIKNLKSRSNGQAMVAVTVNKKIYRKLQKDAKKYGILYHAFEPLKSGKKDSVELIIAEKDLSMLQELLSRYKNEQIKEDVKCGLSKEQSERNYEENNRTETMEEFTNNVGAATSEETFDKDMKERFGEDYQGKVIDYVKASKKIDPKAHTAGVDQKKVGTLAEVIQFRDRAERLKNEAQVKIPFVYDPGNKKSQIIDETETHIKIAGKGLGSSKKQWGGVWVPKESVMPPLEQKNPHVSYTAKEVTDILSDPLNHNVTGGTGAVMLVVLLILEIVFLLITVGCGAMILLEAYQRFFKILMLVPYGTLASSTIAGNHMLAHSAESFWKYALCTIMDAVTMYMALALSAVVISSGSLGLTKNQTGAMYVFAWMLESSFVCMLTLGMVKGAETVTQKALGV